MIEYLIQQQPKATTLKGDLASLQVPTKAQAKGKGPVSQCENAFLL